MNFFDITKIVIQLSYKFPIHLLAYSRIEFSNTVHIKPTDILSQNRVEELLMDNLKLLFTGILEQ